MPPTEHREHLMPCGRCETLTWLQRKLWGTKVMHSTPLDPEKNSFREAADLTPLDPERSNFREAADSIRPREVWVWLSREPVAEAWA